MTALWRGAGWARRFTILAAGLNVLVLYALWPGFAVRA